MEVMSTIPCVIAEMAVDYCFNQFNYKILRIFDSISHVKVKMVY